MNPVGNSQALSKFHKSRRKALIVRAHDGEFARGGVRERAQKPIKSLLPAEPPEKQNEWSLRGNLIDLGGDLSVPRRRFVNAIWNNGQPRQLPSKAAELVGFELRCQMNGGSPLDVRFLDHSDPGRFNEPAAPIDQALDQHPPWREHVMNASLVCSTSCRPGRPQKS